MPAGSSLLSHLDSMFYIQFHCLLVLPLHADSACAGDVAGLAQDAAELGLWALAMGGEV